MTFGNRKGGVKSRPFHLSILPCLFLMHGVTGAHEDVFETAASIDYEDLWMTPAPSCGEKPLTPAIPGINREQSGCEKKTSFPIPPVSAALDWNYRNLAARSGGFSFAHSDDASALTLRLRLLSHIEFHSSVERSHWQRNAGDGSLFVDDDGAAWQSRNSISLAFPWLTTFVSGGVSSNDGWEAALTLKGKFHPEVSWSIAAGRQAATYPVLLTLAGYSPITSPLLIQRDFQIVSAGWEHKRFHSSWTGEMAFLRRPENPASFYSLCDSGWNFKQTASLAVLDSGLSGNFRAGLKGSFNLGKHVFLGTRNSEDPYTFGREETRNQDYSLRADVEAGKYRWETGAFAGFSELVWKGFRPGVPFGRYFWDRNGVLDSYNGGILSVFNQETWLFNGGTGFQQEAAGAWLAKTFSSWRGHAGLGYNHLSLRGRGSLTKKTTTYIIAYTQKDYEYDFQGVDMDLLTPEFQASFHHGRAFAEGSVTQSVPIRIRFNGKKDASGEQEPASSYSGGTRVSVKIGCGFF